MKNKCKTCGKNSESEYCFRCKPRKLIPRARLQFIYKSKVVHEIGEMSEMGKFFMSIWNKKFPHKCYNCGKGLGNEPLSYMFDHILEKGIEKYKHLFLEEENICYLCLECHDNKTRGFLSDKLLQLKEKTLKLFKLN